MSSVPVEKVRWLWYARIPIGALTVVFGPANTGKSTLMYDVLARLSRGDRMPCAAQLPPEDDQVSNAFSVVAGIEDAPSHVASVLDAAGAAMDCIALVDQSQFPNPDLGPLEQLPFLEEQIKQFRARTLYLDNLSEAYIASTDANNEASVRRSLRPLSDMAKRLDISVVIVCHPKKGASAGDIREAISGSQGVFNLARSVLYVAPVPNSNMVGIACAKSSYYPAHLVNTLAFRILSESDGEIDGQPVVGIPSVEWVPGRVPYTAQGLADANAATLAAKQKNAIADALARGRVVKPVVDEEAPPAPPIPPPPVPPVPPAPPQPAAERMARFMASETNDAFAARMMGLDKT